MINGMGRLLDYFYSEAAPILEESEFPQRILVDSHKKTSSPKQESSNKMSLLPHGAEQQRISNHNANSPVNWWAKWIVKAIAATSFISTISAKEQTTNISDPYHNSLSGNFNSDAFFEHPKNWSDRQHSNSLNYQKNRQGISQDPLPEEKPAFRNQKRQDKYRRLNSRWAARHRRHAVENKRNQNSERCGSHKDYTLDRNAIASNKATAQNYARLGMFLECKGALYLLQAASGGNADAAWQYAQHLLGSTTGPSMQPNRETLQAIAYARSLGSQDAGIWIDSYIQTNMRHAYAYMTEGSFDLNKSGGQYTEDSSYFLQLASWAGFGEAQLISARVFTHLKQYKNAWDSLELLALNEEFLLSEMSHENRKLIEWVIKNLDSLIASATTIGVRKNIIDLVKENISIKLIRW